MSFATLFGGFPSALKTLDDFALHSGCAINRSVTASS